MPLQKNAVDISFAQGLDQKTDPWRVQAGKFLSLQNSVFQKGGRLTKRNGYGVLASIFGSNSSSPSSYLTTLNNNLTAIGNSISAYNENNQTWATKGNLTPMSTSTLPLIRNNLSQTQCDTAIINNTACTVYSELNNATTTIKYVITDATTGQNIVAPTALPVTTSGSSPRVFALPNYFIIVYTNVHTSTPHLQYLAISALNPTVTATSDIVTSYSSAATVAWDGVVVGQNLYLAYNTTTGGQAVKVTYITQAQAAIGGSPVTASTFATYIGSMFTVCADTTVPTVPIIYVSWAVAGGNAYTLAVDQNLNTILAPTSTTGSSTFSNITSTASSGICTVFVEIAGNYSYDSSIPSHSIVSYTITQAGGIAGLFSIVNSVGLASKAFTYNNTTYFLGAYQSTYQSSYFLINGSASVQTAPVIAAKLAYENGGGYLTIGLPQVQVTGGTAQFAYLYKDLIEPLNTLRNPQQTTAGGIYSQTGVNLATMKFTSTTIDTTEIANVLTLSGGFTGMYDGFAAVEQNFFLWPDSVEATWNATSTVTPTGTFSSGSTSVVVSSASGVSVGMSITDTSNAYIPANTYITNIVGTTLTISQATTHAGAGDNLSIQGNIAAKPDGSTNTSAYYYQAIYEWSDNTGNIHRSAPSIPVAVTTTGSGSAGTVTINVPTLRLTMKTANPIKIVLYRWSVANPIYYQVTSVTAPLLNILSSSSVSFVDTLSDANIIGNSIIYTNGGVVEDENPPATNIMTLFDTRVWLVDAEDQNLLWYSKQVIEATPVEMSALFTMYVAPNTGTASSTGPITALSPMDDKLIIFKKDAIYYINGSGPDNTGSNSQYSQPIFITSTVGCNNQQSVVLTPTGLMFQSDKGIWLLDRSLNSSYIGAPVNDFNSSTVNSAVNVPGTNQIRFTLNTGQTLTYDYYYQQWSTFVGVPAVSSCIYQGLHTFINQYGVAYQETPGLYLDGANPVLLSFTTSWFNLAGLQGYERAYYFYLLGEYFSPHKLQLQISYDYVASPVQSRILTPMNFSNTVASPFGDQPAPFGSPTSIEQWRVDFTKQKCQAFQITMNEIFDYSYNVMAGQGLSLSGLNLVVGAKKGYRPIKASNQIGGNG